jgi:hypothetical protein
LNEKTKQLISVPFIFPHFYFDDDGLQSANPGSDRNTNTVNGTTAHIKQVTNRPIFSHRNHKT